MTNQPQADPDFLLQPEKYADCEVEYHPIAKRYFPKYKGKYLLYCHSTKVYEPWSSVSLAARSNNEKEALRILDEFLETQGIEVVRKPASEIAKEINQNQS